MSDKREFRVLRPRIKSLSPSDGNGYKPRLVSRPDTQLGKDPQANLRHAFIFLALALVLVLADRLGRTSKAPDSMATGAPLQGVSLVLHPRPHVKSQHGLLVQFRLSNMGNRLVFYPARRGTNVPVGQIIAWNSQSSQPMAGSGISNQHGLANPELTNASLVWIEMPPGGWVDGEFEDPSEFAGDHEYTIFLKPNLSANELPIVSEPYHSDRN